MSEKRFIGYDFGEYENRNYAVYDLSKSEKTKEDFWDNEEECYEIWAFVDYLEGNDCVLSCDDVVGLLNQLHQENQSLKEQIKEMQQDEKLYANEIVKLNKENKEVLNFKKLGGDY